MPDIALRIASLTLAAVFAWSAGSKLVRFEAWRTVLAGYRLPSPLELTARILVPVTEFAVAAALLLGAVRLGAAAALALLAAFSVAILRARSLQGDKLPCGCFGGVKNRDYRWSLARNAAFAFVALLVLTNGEDVSPLNGFAAPSGSEGAAFILVLAGVALIAWMVWTVSRAVKSDGTSIGSGGVQK